MERHWMLIALIFSLLNLAEVPAVALSLETQTEIKAAVINRFQTERGIKEVEIFPNPQQQDVYAVLWNDGFWFKSLRLIKYKNGVIEWVSGIDPKFEWEDRSILAAEWKMLPKIGITILEVYTSTHKGNGEYIVFQLQNQGLKRLLHVRAIGNYDYGQRSPRLPGIDGASACRVGKIIKTKNDPFEEIEVSGVVQYFDNTGKNVVKTEVIRQLFKWNQSKKTFEEDPAERKGTGEFLSIY